MRVAFRETVLVGSSGSAGGSRYILLEVILEGRSRRHQVLVVDDEADSRHQLAHFLRSKGHTPVEVGSSDAAHRWLHCHQVDALVLNLELPGAGGLDFVQELRATDTWRHLPIVVVTAVQHAGEVVRAIGLGANDCIPKPYDPDTLVARLESHLRYHDLLGRLRKQNELLGRLAVLDELTQLYNRRAFMEALTLELEHMTRLTKPCSLMFIDIDHFKRVNDTYGHLAGDEVLQQVARRLEAAVRNADVVGRYGGEEFCVVIPDVEVDLALLTAERIRRSINEPHYTISGQTALQLSASIGVAWMPGGTNLCPNQMIKIADDAMFHAKRLGRNRIYLAETVQAEEFEPKPLASKVATPYEE